MKEKANEREYDFTLVLTGVEELTQDVVDALFEAGCDDATLADRGGRIFMTFARTALSLKDAILSAIQQVRAAGIGADVLRVDDGHLVTLADISRRIGRSRQLVHQYMTGKRGPGGFPGPVCEVLDRSFLWLWSEVAMWLWRNGLIDENVLHSAKVAQAINAALEFVRQKRTDRKLADEVMRSVNRS